jgi:hypothetical protein
MFGKRMVDPEPPFVARTAPARMVLTIVGALSFVVLGLWIAGVFGAPPAPRKVWAGWLAVVIFGACAVQAIRMLVDAGEQVVVDRHGIRYARRSDTTIPWSQVASMGVHSVHRQRFLSLTLREPGLYPPTTFVGQLGSLNRALGFGDIAIGTTGTDRSFDELLAAVDVHRPR